VMIEWLLRVNSAHYQPVVESTELSATATGYISVADRPIADDAVHSLECPIPNKSL